MKQNASIVLACMMLFLATPTVAFGQSGSMDLPSIGTSHGTIYLNNPTNGSVIFYLESKGTDRTEHILEPNTAATFSGVSGDKWFNIEIYSDGGKVAYGIDAGSRHYFKWRGNVLDLYRLPPK